MGEPEQARFDSNAVALRREGLQERVFKVARWMFLLPAIVLPVGVVFDHLLHPPLEPLNPVIFSLFFALVIALYASVPVALAGAALSIAWGRGAARVSIRDGALRMEHGRRVHTVPLDQLRSGWVQPGTMALDEAQGWLHPPCVELETRRGDVFTLEAPSTMDARALLEAAGLDARHRVARLRLGPTDFQTAMLYLLGPSLTWSLALPLSRALGVGAIGGLYLGLLLFVLLRGAVQAFLGPARLTIGADGVKIEQNLSSEFIPYQHIRDWIIDDRAVTFVLRDGRRVAARGRHLRFDPRSAAVRERLEEARRLYLSGEPSTDARALLARGQRTLSDWRSGLRSLLDRSGYRQAPLSEDDLLLVLQSPDEPAELRLGAALALPPGEPSRQRLRVAAEACANPRLRVALERLADGDDDPSTLEAALGEPKPQLRA